jgi:DHA2 family multidrug resistance protein
VTAWLALLGAIMGAFSAIMGINAMSSATDLLASSINAPSHRISSATSLYLVAQIASAPTALLWLKYGSPIKVSMIASLFFAGASVLCAMATNLDSFLLSRVAQGLSSGVLIALPPIIIRCYFKENEHKKGLAAYAFCGVMAPITGPVLVGGLSGETIHYVFYVCAGLSLIAAFLMQNTPKLLIKQPVQVTNLGNLFAMATFTIGLATFVYTLESGADLFWFESMYIRWGIIMSLILIVLAICHQITTASPLIPFRIALNRDLATILITSFGMGIAIYGFMYLIPYYLIKAHSSSPKEIMYIVLYSAIPQAILLPIFIKVKDNLPSVYLIAAGGICMTMGMYFLSGVNVLFEGDQFALPQLLRALGIPICVLSLSLLLIQKSPANDIAGAVVLQGLCRSLGGALSIATMTAFVQTRHSAYMQSQFHNPTDDSVNEVAWQYAFSDMFSLLTGFFAFMTCLLVFQAVRGFIRSTFPPLSLNT